MTEFTFKKGRKENTKQNQLASESQPSRKSSEIQIWKGERELKGASMSSKEQIAWCLLWCIWLIRHWAE